MDFQPIILESDTFKITCYIECKDTELIPSLQFTAKLREWLSEATKGLGVNPDQPQPCKGCGKK